MVRRGKWKNITVAVKEIHTKDEIATFTKEVETLSRVHHPNIVQLFGASIKEPCCLVMEYADGGSLYDGQYHFLILSFFGSFLVHFWFFLVHFFRNVGGVRELLGP